MNYGGSLAGYAHGDEERRSILSGAKIILAHHASPVGKDQRLGDRPAKRRSGTGDDEKLGGKLRAATAMARVKL